MAGPHTPDLPGWNLASPPIYPARTLGLEIGADIPLFADTCTHICGLATGVVSVQFFHFSATLIKKKYWVIVYIYVLNDFTKRNLTKMPEIVKNGKN